MKVLSALIALLSALGVLYAQPVQRPSAAADAPSALLRDAHCRQFLARCLVEGQLACLMVDTGATHTVLASDFVRRQLPNLRFVEGVKLSGNASAPPRLALAAIQAGEVKWEQSPVLVMELEGVNAMLGRRIDGILGMSHLAHVSFTLDLRQGRQGHWGLPTENLELTPLRGQRDGAGRLLMTARCGAAACRLLLDTGSTVTTWPRGQWPAGERNEVPVQVGDVNGARVESLGYGHPARLQLGEQVTLPQVSPQLRPGGEGHVLGVDALEGGVLVHRAGSGFELMLPPGQQAGAHADESPSASALPPEGREHP